MASLLDLLKKGGNAIKDAFTYTDEEKASGKTPSVLEKIPMRASETRDNIESFFAPAPNEVRARDVVRELQPKNVVKNIQEYFAPAPEVRVRDVVRETPGAVVEVGKDILQGTLRSLDYVGRKGLDTIYGKYGPTAELERERQAGRTNTTLDQILFGGRDKRVSTLGERGQVELGIDPEKRPFLAPLAGFGLTALDLVPGGQGKGKVGKELLESFGDDVIKSFSKTGDKSVIESVITSSVKDIDDVVARELAEEIANETTEQGVRDLIGRVETLAPDRARGQGLVHLTPESNLDSIRKSGLTPSKDGYQGAGTYFGRSIDEASGTVGDLTENVALRINPKTKSKYGFEEGFDNEYITQATIKPKDIEVSRDGRTWEPLLKESGDVSRATTPAVPKTVQVSDEILGRIDIPEKGTSVGELPDTLYHGTTKENAESIVANGFDSSLNTKGFAESPYAVFASVAEDGLDDHSAKTYGEAVLRLRARAGEQLNVLSEEGWYSTLGKSRGGRESEQIAEALRQAGYDAVRDPSGEVIILNPNKFEVITDGKKLMTPEDVAEARTELAKKMSVDEVPSGHRPEVKKSLDKAEVETKKLSERRLKDAKKYGISEDVMSRMLYAKAGGRMTHDEASNLAETLRAPMKDLLEKPANSFPLNRPKIEAYSQELQGYFENVVKDLKAQSEAFPDDTILRQQYQEASRNYMKARTTLEAVISEAGRVVEGSKVIGKYSRLPQMDTKIKQVRDQIVKYAEQNPKHADLPTEFDMALETVDVNNATQLLDFLTQWNRASFLQKLSEYQKASLLSALSTHAVNALGNAIQQVLDIPVRALAGGLDAVRAGVTKTPREVYAGESLAQVRGAFRSAPSALERAWKALKNEHFAQELRRTEIEAGTPVPAIRGRFGKVVRLPFRLLQMADLGFRTVKQGAESNALALRIAKKEGLKGKALKERVDELSKNLPEDMLDLVDERVERSLMLEELDGLLKSVEDLKNKYPIMQFVIPFYRTLVNLSREAYRMTPIGGVGRTVGRVLPGKAGRDIERGFSNKWTADQNTRMEELSRQIIGTGIMAWVVSSMLNGDVEITGPAPSKAGDRETFYGQGKLPHSIRVGDTWIEFQRVQPIGQLLQIGASISEAVEAYKNTGQLSSEEAEREALNAITDIGSMVFTQSPFTGMADLFALAQGGAYNEGYIKAGNRYIGQMMGTFIPNVLRRLTVAGDPIIYEKRDIKSQLKSRVPGLQDDLTPRRDVFGEIARQDGTFLSRFASPIRTSESIEGSLYDEFDAIGYTPTVPDREAFNEELSVKEYETLQKYYGPRFRDELWATVNDEAYKTLNDEQKQDVIAGISRKVLQLARSELFPVYAEKNEYRKQWTQEGYTPLVIEDALQAKFPYDKATLEAYAEAMLDRSIESGEARETIENLLQRS